MKDVRYFRPSRYNSIVGVVALIICFSFLVLIGTITAKEKIEMFLWITISAFAGYLVIIYLTYIRVQEDTLTERYCGVPKLKSIPLNKIEKIFDRAPGWCPSNQKELCIGYKTDRDFSTLSINTFFYSEETMINLIKYLKTKNKKIEISKALQSKMRGLKPVQIPHTNIVTEARSFGRDILIMMLILGIGKIIAGLLS